MQTHFSAGVTAQPVARWLLVLAYGCIVLGSDNLQAQMVYRIVGPDGQVTFSDKPSVSPASKVTPVDNAMPAAAPNGVPLPYELRQLVGKYPVTLYTSSNCAPCDSGRSLLAARGVPFSEKTIGSAQDAEALQKLSGSNSLPFLTIGAQHVAGYSATEWTQYLNAAGYPESSRLPANYRAPLAAPLVTPEKPVTPATSAAEPADPVLPPITPPAISPGNPAGIQF
ncbi:MAG: NrdH-redoxin [Betaproteobacteria bacterium HGW-Betaproteobacteria-18]|nr:MAG: NrdH-redoxin [Betaproteobacteria bacterium HGW-Betaproteobacteria-18]